MAGSADSEAPWEGVHVIVRTLAGRELLVTLTPDALVKEVKEHVKTSWGIPVMEQKLVHMGNILPNNDKLSNHSTCEQFDVMLVRGAAFHFDKSLAHPCAKLGCDSAAIGHGGQSEYQAAFLSDILDTEGSYSVRFKLEDAGGRHFEEMYVGVAPDADRNWSDLKGAYLNRCGVLVDAFSQAGWLRENKHLIRNEIFEKSEFCRQRLQAEENDLYMQLNDAYREVAGIEEANFMAQDALKAHQEAIENLASMSNSCEFILEVDIPNCQLRFLTSRGVQVEMLHLPQLLTEPVRLCATLGYPKQTVLIMDA